MEERPQWPLQFRHRTLPPKTARSGPLDTPKAKPQGGSVVFAHADAAQQLASFFGTLIFVC